MDTVRSYIRGVDLTKLITEPQPPMNDIIKLDTKGGGPKPKSMESLYRESPFLSTKTVLSKTDEIPFILVGHKAYDDDSYESSRICMQCFMTIPIDRQRIGIPIKCTVVDNIRHYHMIDVFCCFSCVYTELKKRLNHSLYTNSLTYFKDVYEGLTGLAFETLSPSPDNRLLKALNGPLTWEEYHSGTIKCPKCTSCIYFHPITEKTEV